MLVVTTNDLPGYRVVRHLGLVRGLTVRSRSIVGNIGAAIQIFFGGNITLYTQLAEQARKGTRDAFWGDSFVATPIYDGTALASGASIEGTALIEEAFTVVVLPPGARAELDALGNYVIEV